MVPGFLRTPGVLPAFLLTLCAHPGAPATLGAQEAGPGAGLRIQPWGAVFFRGADPNLQPTPLFLDVRSGEAVDPAVRGVAGVALDLRLGRYLSAGVRAHYDTDPTNSPLARTRKVVPLDPRGELDQFWVRLGGGAGALTVGRMSLLWGPSPRGGLVLSGQAPALDMVHGKLNLWGHSLESFLANLSGAGEDLRILYGHRVVLNPLKTLTVSLVDMTLVRRRTAGVYWPFLVPWIPNFFPEWRDFPGVPRGSGVNSQVSAAVEWRPGPRFFFEFLGDDVRWSEYQETYPNRFAVSAGVDHEWDRWRGGYEFRRVESWTYTHFQPSTALRQFRWPLGAPEGPDGDRHILWGVAGGGDWTLHLTGERRRRGENRLGDVWDGEGRRGEGFPRGMVETRWILEAGLRRRVSRWGTAHLSAFYQDIDNLNNQPGRRSLLGLQAGFHLLSPALTVNWLPSSARHGS